MPVIDQRVTWRKVEERLATEADPTLRRNLELLLQHMKAEASLDLPRLMATVSEKARYENFAPNAEPPLVGKGAVQRFYEDFAASGAYRLQLEIDRLVVDRHCILTEGVMRMAYPGRTLLAMGKKIDDPNAYYLYETRMSIIWPIGPDGLFIGEDSYVGGDGFAGIEARKVDLADVVLYEPKAA
ncbi:nuclear transport factor 2 family protein [Myxococcota bacterium]|nr:nuclear transport factor 2 family protein [Myxococcota bacterium]